MAVLPEFRIPAEANKSYQVSTNIQINGNYSFPDNVTLYFTGGKFIGNNYILTGRNTKIIAGITQIFDKGLKFEGSWIMDRAYPQWFGAQNTYKYTGNDDKIYDATDAINKAIRLKRVGEVFIPRGEYLIAGTIRMKYGIILKGEKALTGNDQSAVPVINIDQNIFENGGTILRSLKGGKVGTPENKNVEYPEGYMMLLNIHESNLNDGVVQWPEYHTAIQDIYFINESITNLKGIYAHGGFNIEFCRWKNFAQAVATTKKYADHKTINFCNFYNGINHTDKLYAFDLNQGDALNFKNVITGLNNSSIKGILRINLCNGGVISHCILNDNVLIDNSKALVFTSNHLEGKKTQMTVLRSIVNISNNFFEKGCYPSLRIDGNDSGDFIRSVVTLDNNAFCYYDNDYDNKPWGISDYEIMTNGQVIIKNNRSFRYWVLRNQIAKVAPYGLRICRSKEPARPNEIYNMDNELTPVSTFNDYSHLLSADGEMTPAYSLCFNKSLIVPQALTSPWKGRVSDITWKLSSSSVPTYRAQIIIDKNRCIIGNTLNLGSVAANETRGVLITLGGISENGYNCMIRLERILQGTSNKMICDIPLCGAIHLYDNGLDVCGYKWINGSLLSGINVEQSIQYTGKNVICRSTTIPTIGTWANGDIIYNMGTGTNALWIRQDNTWKAK